MNWYVLSAVQERALLGIGLSYCAFNMPTACLLRASNFSESLLDCRFGLGASNLSVKSFNSTKILLAFSATKTRVR